MKLYYHPYSIFARRVRLCLLEKGVDTELVEVDMANKAHKSAEYGSLNPNHKVPTLVADEGLVLYESTAILYYLEDQFPDPSLLPSRNPDLALAHMWLTCCDNYMAGDTVTVIFPKRFLPRSRWDDDAIAQASERIGRHLRNVSNQLGDNDYLIGNRFSLADVSYLPFLAFRHLFDTEIPPNVEAWAQRMLARPAARQTEPAR